MGKDINGFINKIKVYLKWESKRKQSKNKRKKNETQKKIL